MRSLVVLSLQFASACALPVDYSLHDDPFWVEKGSQFGKAVFREYFALNFTGMLKDNGGDLVVDCLNSTEQHNCSHVIHMGPYSDPIKSAAGFSWYRNFTSNIGGQPCFGRASWMWSALGHAKPMLLAVVYLANSSSKQPFLQVLPGNDPGPILPIPKNVTSDFVSTGVHCFGLWGHNCFPFVERDKFSFTGHLDENGGNVSATCLNETDTHKCSFVIEFGRVIDEDWDRWRTEYYRGGWVVLGHRRLPVYVATFQIHSNGHMLKELTFFCAGASQASFTQDPTWNLPLII